MRNQPKKSPAKLNVLIRALLEIGFIVFLFYSNLLMGEYNRSASGALNGIVWALQEIFTWANFTIALITGAIGYFVFEYLRKRL